MLVSPLNHTIMKGPSENRSLQMVSMTSLHKSVESDTFEMEKYVRLVVLEHLGNQLDIHILDVYFLWSIRYL